jgi:hypothetical protein
MNAVHEVGFVVLFQRHAPTTEGGSTRNKWKYRVFCHHFSATDLAKGAEDLYSDGGEGDLSVF